MFLDLFSEKAPCGSILVSNHSVVAFWVVTNGRFDCRRVKLHYDVKTKTNTLRNMLCHERRSSVTNGT